MSIPHLFGLGVQNHPTSPNTKIIVLPGKASSLVDHAAMTLATALTKRLDVVWTAGNDAGMRDTAAAIVCSATYHVFLIGNDSTGDIDVLASLSAVSPALPVGWSAYRRLGAILTDEVGNIRAFVQSGGWFELVTPIRWANTLSVTTIAANTFVGSPTGVKCLVEIGLFGNSGGAYLSTGCPDAGTASLSKANQYVVSTFGFTANVMTDAAGRVSLRASDPLTLVGGYLKKWYDGRDTYV